MKQKRRFGFEHLESRAMLSASGDFNGDGFADLAIGAEGTDLQGIQHAGAVQVLYGGDDGLSADNNQYWSTNSAGVNGHPSNSAAFGAALAVGDFDNDGFDDLAIGEPVAPVPGTGVIAGVVHILYGSSTGLRATDDQLWSRDSSGVNGKVSLHQSFGRSLAAGDFDADGFDDLAIGSPFDNLPGVETAGAVNILYGSSSGLSAKDDQLWTQDTLGIDGVPAGAEHFGSTLATGDFNGDGRDDLAIGVDRDRINGMFCGSVNIIYGSSNGLTAAGDQLWRQSTPGVLGTAEENDDFGRAIAVGDFNGDTFDDIAIGAPGGEVNGEGGAGEVNVLYGSASKIQIGGQRLLTRNLLGGISGNNEGFGSALAAGDFNGNGRDDLAIGVPHADVNGIVQAGFVQIVYGSSTGLSTVGSQIFSEATPGVLGEPAQTDSYGEVLTSGDYDNDGRDDVVIGIPRQTVAGREFAGEIAVLYGSATGITTAGDQLWNAGSTGILAPNQAFAAFGGILA
jgi:hypothetical protein